MITCRDLAEFLLDFLDGSLPPEHRQRIEYHLQKCPPCVIYLETYRLTIELTRKLPCQPLPPELVNRLREALKEIRGEQPGCAGPSPPP